MSEHGQPEGAAAMPVSGLAKAADSIEAFVKPIYTWLTYIGAGVLGALVVVMVWSIIGRRFFNAPLKGSTEITQFALAIMTFLVVGLEHMGHEKMTVDIIIKHFSKRAQAIIAPIIYILIVGIFCIACWQLVVLAHTYQDAHQTLRNIRVPIYPVAYLAAFGMLTMIPVYIARFLHSVDRLVKK
jgi:TRAP-type C4-dicarboxylate transport system permease small subunit